MTLVERATSHHGGELVLLRRRDGLELRVDGVFVMDTVETSSERALAGLALDAATSPQHVVVAGLGLGCTLARVLADDRVRAVSVLELESAIVDWLRADVVPGGSALLADARVRVHLGDALGWIASAAPGSADVLLLDVDNGPDYLVHEGNRALYAGDTVRRCGQVLSPDGVLAVWSMNDSAALSAALRDSFTDVRTHTCLVRLQGRDLAYWVLVAARPLRHPPPPSRPVTGTQGSSPVYR